MYLWELGGIYKEDFVLGIVVVLVGGIIMVCVMFNIWFFIIDVFVLVLV